MITQTSGVRIQITNTLMVSASMMLLSEGQSLDHTEKTVSVASMMVDFDHIHTELVRHDQDIETTLIMVQNLQNHQFKVSNCSKSRAIFGISGACIDIHGVQKAGIGYSRFKDTRFTCTNFPLVSHEADVTYLQFDTNPDFVCIVSEAVSESIGDALGPLIYVASFMAMNLDQYDLSLKSLGVGTDGTLEEIIGQVICCVSEEEGARENCSVAITVDFGRIMLLNIVLDTEDISLFSMINSYYQAIGKVVKPACRITKEERQAELADTSNINVSSLSRLKYKRFLTHASFDSQIIESEHSNQQQEDLCKVQYTYNQSQIGIQ